VAWNYSKQVAMAGKYGMTESQWQRIYDQQDGRCAICRKYLDDCTACVDHDHETGDIRGILCTQCNSGLGMFKDNVVFLELAAKYLTNYERSRER